MILSCNFNFRCCIVTVKKYRFTAMATEKTPPLKRIARAEKSSQDWKLKAIKRREEAAQLKNEMKNLRVKIKKNENIENTITKLNSEIETLRFELDKAMQIDKARLDEIEELKKKPFDK